MITSEPASFFQSFNFDTLLAIISCIAGVIALFLGGSAYRNYKNVKSLNDTKEYNDSSTDNSQKAGGDIYNQTCDVTALAALTTENFSIYIRQVFDYFDQRTNDNLHKIIEETNRIVSENKIDIAKYTKIDWINIYLEYAKNTSDTYMQNIWAKVLARELGMPGSFSFRTLDVLKNMSADDFKLYEKLCSLQTKGYILGNNFTRDFILWEELLKLSELGLISLKDSTYFYDIDPHNEKSFLVCNERLVIILRNESDNAVKAQYHIYYLTSAATEMLCVATFTYQREYIIKVAKQIQKECNKVVRVELHEVDWVKGMEVSAKAEDLLSS